MSWGKSLLRAGLLASTCLGASMVGVAQAQVLINQNIPDPSAGFGADYLRRGSGYGSVADTANGQATTVGTTVLTRPQPEFDAQGAQLGKIRIDLNGSEGLGYDSNPLGLSSSKGSITNESQAAVTASGVWDTAGVTARLSIDDVRYWRFSQLNHTDYTAYLGGYYDFANDRLQGSFTHLKLNELPTGVDSIGIGNNQVIPFTDDVFRVSYTKQFGRFTFIPDAGYSIIRFGNSIAAGLVPGAAVFDATANDRNESQLGLTIKYEMSPGKDIVGVVRGTNGQFNHNLPGLNQDYMDYQFLAGFDVQTQGKFRYRGLVGYEVRKFRASGISSQNTPIFEGQVIWVPTQLTTVTATASREITNSIAGGTSSFKYTTGRLQVDHEVRRNIIATAFGQLQNGQFQQNLSANMYDVGVSGTYKLNRHVSLVLSNEFTHRSSSDKTRLNDFSENITLLTVRLAL